jgi:hypothetical protein
MRKIVTNLTEYAVPGGGNIPTFPKAKDPMVWAREKIEEHTKNDTPISFFYKESLRYIISKLGTLVYINSEDEVINIRCMHANPERTIAALKQESNIILPVLSISQNSSDNADVRRRNAPVIINETYWSDVKKRAFRVLSLAPRAVNIQYNINIWAKYKSNLDQVVEQIRLLFNPHMVIENQYTNVAQAYVDSEVDKSSVEVGDRQQRILRRSFDIKLEAYIPNPKFLITSTGEIEEFDIESSLY